MYVVSGSAANRSFSLGWLALWPGVTRRFFSGLEMVRVEHFSPRVRDHMPGCPQKHRTLPARKFLAEMVLDIAGDIGVVGQVRSEAGGMKELIIEQRKDFPSTRHGTAGHRVR